MICEKYKNIDEDLKVINYDNIIIDVWFNLIFFTLFDVIYTNHMIIIIDWLFFNENYIVPFISVS